MSCYITELCLREFLVHTLSTCFSHFGLIVFHKDVDLMEYYHHVKLVFPVYFDVYFHRQYNR